MPQFLLLYHSNSWLSSKGIVTQTLHTLIEGVIFHYVHWNGSLTFLFQPAKGIGYNSYGWMIVKGSNSVK